MRKPEPESRRERLLVSQGGTMNAKDVMTQDIARCLPLATAQAAASLMTGCDLGAVPIKEVVRPKPVTSRPKDGLDDCERLRQKRRISGLLLMDEAGRRIDRRNDPRSDRGNEMIAQAPIVLDEPDAKVRQELAEILMSSAGSLLRNGRPRW